MEASRLLDMMRPHLANEIKIMEGTLAAILVIIHLVNGKPYVILTERGSRLKNHAGQISFPGGSFSESDKDFMGTAIRETLEEIGLNISGKDIIGSLRSVHTLTSNFTIVPYVAIIESIGDLKPNSKEIDAIMDVPLLELLKTMTPDLDHPGFGEIYKFEFNDNVVWGATARILKQMRDLLQKCGMI